MAPGSRVICVRQGHRWSQTQRCRWSRQRAALFRASEAWSQTSRGFQAQIQAPLALHTLSQERGCKPPQMPGRCK